eukprot:6205713-Pleurochrysis_carterae.AAC.3
MPLVVGADLNGINGNASGDLTDLRFIRFDRPYRASPTSLSLVAFCYILIKVASCKLETTPHCQARQFMDHARPVLQGAELSLLGTQAVSYSFGHCFSDRSSNDHTT